MNKLTKKILVGAAAFGMVSGISVSTQVAAAPRAEAYTVSNCYTIKDPFYAIVTQNCYWNYNWIEEVIGFKRDGWKHRECLTVSPYTCTKWYGGKGY